VRAWPPITEPELLERLALGDEDFRAFIRTFVAALGRRSLTPEVLEWALGYPWERPAASYVLRDGEVQELADVPAGERAAVVASFTADRHPVLSYGGNGAPSWLERKFAHFPDEADRTALVLTGRLEDFDVGPAAAIGAVGYMPATLFASPGTRVRAAVVWATPAQVTQLAWSEVTYRVVRLDDAHFTVDDADVAVDDVFAFLHRLGSFCPDGEPVALAAVPAEHRTARALTQRELLGIAAGLVLGDGAQADDLVHAVFDDMSAVTARAEGTLWPRGRHLEARWTAFGG
jgi:hypothetical protein